MSIIEDPPSEGGTRGLVLFKNYKTDEVRGPRTVDLGTAIVAMDGEIDARNAIAHMNKQDVVRDRELDDWRLKPWNEDFGNFRHKVNKQVGG